MKKKFKRGERKRLIQSIENLGSTVRRLIGEKSELEEQLDRTKKRLEAAGSEIKTIDEPIGKIQIIHPEVETYGNYATFTDADEEQREYIKKELARRLAEGLINQNIVQIICKEPGAYIHLDPLYRHGTIGAKLFVIPWEQMKTGKMIEIRRYMD